MADGDELDAFFDEVSEAEAKVVDEEGEIAQSQISPNEFEKPQKETEEPPTKRPKPNVAARPRGVVVASSTSVVISASEREEKQKAAAAEAEKQLAHAQASTTFHAPTSIGPGGPQFAGPSIGPAFSGGLANPNNLPPKNGLESQQPKKNKSVMRVAAGQTYIDSSLAEWPENDYRIFVGNLSNEVADTHLHQHFSKYPSLAKAKVVRHNNNPEKSKGYGFVSFLDPLECAQAIREMDQTWLCSRPIRVKRSDWKERDFKHVMKKQKKEKKQQKRMGLNL